MMSRELTHLDDQGQARMVEVGAKPPLRREAVATGFIRLQPETLARIQADQIAKGSVLAVARVAGIQAAKRTWDLIPLCHQIPLSSVQVDFHFETEGMRIAAVARTIAQTGVEMEALTAVSIAALTIYDMAKAIDKTMEISNIQLIAKTKEPA